MVSLISVPHIPFVVAALDVLVAPGDTGFGNVNIMYLNDGTGKFTARTDLGTINVCTKCTDPDLAFYQSSIMGMAVGDVDGDGGAPCYASFSS